MKNLITIATLLVAGTAFANAEENTLPEPNWTTLTLTAPSNNELTASNSGFSWSGDPSGSLTDSWQLSFSWTSTNTGNTIDLFGTSRGGGGGAAGIVLQWKSESNGTLYFGTKGGSDGVSLTSITKPTTGTTVVLTYLKSSDSSATSSVLKLKFGDQEKTVTAPTNNTTFLGNDGNTRLWTNGGKDIYSNISLKYGAAVSPAVPEPSAFGLLAGLGALALVGARRRRR